MNSLLGRLVCSANLANSLGKRAISTTEKLCLFWEKDDKGGYTDPLPPFTTRMKVGLSELRKEVVLWKEEFKEAFDGDPILIHRPGETDIAWRFKTEESLEKWKVVCDADHNEGYSQCSLTRNNHGNGVFSGNINLRVPKDGRVKRAGYCNMKTFAPRRSFKREAYYDWTGYNTLVMKVRGDGRTYLLNLATRGYFDMTWNDMYHYQLYTRGGPYWQIAKIPFSKFFFASKGRIQDEQRAIRLDMISAFGISAQDRHGGPFSLEIDYIGLEYDPRHVEEFAYEQYELENGLAGT
ncbi:unnamed protein product [Ceutorhynchus assimilis]|uniref:NADH:ubiquinone oxidoreductase intermediate-associated protein 30 domain-containing protein n=1 Tax=Ceutorhynchus assimilis TaxID=467358 RepID=A0A9N9MHF2_9CUCU|nr:unnamed protein product [Ceutorhynchus assimilis]